jgi:uncharacterized protein with von Willebrand factor type A (vWA) domain
MSKILDNLEITTDFTMRLCALLRREGVAVGLQQSIACLQAILLLGTVNEEELKAVFRTTLINRKDDFWQLHRAYDLLIKDYLATDQPDSRRDTQQAEPALVQRRLQSEDTSSLEAGEAATRTEGYSVREVDQTKDFRLIPKRDLSAAIEELRKVARKHASVARRKTVRAHRGRRIDLQGSIRDSVRFGGEVVTWRFKRKKPNRSRFVIVADVSGSMEIYSIFLLNFLHVLNSSHRMKMESFVFSTRLERLTKQFRSRQFDEMLRQSALQFSAWAGGTKIGASLASLNETYGRLITRKTTVVILSDGWDTGEVELLGQEMAALHRRAKAIIWINPLKAAPGYQPLAMGMAAARPYCDRFITGHSIESLEAFASMLGI